MTAITSPTRAANGVTAAAATETKYHVIIVSRAEILEIYKKREEQGRKMHALFVSRTQECQQITGLLRENLSLHKDIVDQLTDKNELLEHRTAIISCKTDLQENIEDLQEEIGEIKDIEELNYKTLNGSEEKQVTGYIQEAKELQTKAVQLLEQIAAQLAE